MHCSCPPGESCSVEINELPGRRFEVIVTRPRPVIESYDWPAVSTSDWPGVSTDSPGAYRRLFDKRTTASRIRDVVIRVIGAPIGPKDASAEPPKQPSPEKRVVFVHLEMLHQARKLIAGCQACSRYAGILFESILDRVSGHDPAVTRYILLGSVKCPRCLGRVTGSTLVEFEPPSDDAN